MFNQESKTYSNINYSSQYFRKADKLKGLFGTYFDLRFPQIKNSLVDTGLIKTIWGLLNWKLRYTSQANPTNQQQLQATLPMTKPNFHNQSNQIKYTWIGHSTAVISFGKDANFIIDPVFSQRSSPFQFLGPKRFRPPACSIDQLPKIDIVLVSHDHYDHLDAHSLKKIFHRFPDARFIAGLGSTDVFPRKCSISELDWTQTKKIQINNKQFKITFAPVCHWGCRGLFDKNKRLWGGFVIQGPNNKRIFYSGDTGYTGIFKELGQIYDGFDLCILPIGAYYPRQFLKNQHIDPLQAVKIHKQLKSKKSVGVHWGTFPLGYEHYASARKDLQKSKQTQKIKKDEFITIGHGQSLTINYHKKDTIA